MTEVIVISYNASGEEISRDRAVSVRPVEIVDYPQMEMFALILESVAEFRL